MRLPTWIKPAAWGAVVGGIGTIIVGFSWGGWMLGGTADKMAEERSAAAVTKALVPICVSQSAADPQKRQELAQITYPYERQEFVFKAGWATVPGSDEPNSELAAACARTLSKAGET